jgi:hypothetical protein
MALLRACERKGPQAGDRVRSHYRATWYGVVVSRHEGWVDHQTGEPVAETVYVKGVGYRAEADPSRPLNFIPEGCALVRVERDQHNNPMRKPMLKVLHTNYLEILSQDLAHV